MILLACQSGRYGTLVLVPTTAKKDREDDADPRCFTAYPVEFIGEYALCWIPGHNEGGLAGTRTQNQRLKRALLYH